MAIKNTFDYRIVRKNINNIKSLDDVSCNKEYNSSREPVLVQPRKKIKRNVKVRKRIKE